MRVQRNEYGQRVGESHPHARLTDEQVRVMFLWRAEGMTHREVHARLLADGATVAISTVHAILRGRRRVGITVRVTDG